MQNGKYVTAVCDIQFMENVMTTRIFVYGTLRSEQPNHHLLTRATLVGQAKTTPEFSMISCGGFPAIAKGGNTAIVGEIYDVDSQTLTRLDRLEGVSSGHYTREEISLEGGQTAMAYFYPASRVSERQLINSGDWVEFIKRPQPHFAFAQL